MRISRKRQRKIINRRLQGLPGTPPKRQRKRNPVTRIAVAATLAEGVVPTGLGFGIASGVLAGKAAKEIMERLEQKKKAKAIKQARVLRRIGAKTKEERIRRRLQEPKPRKKEKK